MKRSGFTLIEMIITVGISVVVMGELVVVLVGLFQMEKNKMWDAELASKLRAAREQLLFNAVPAEGGKKYGGILSATNLVWSDQQITAAFQYAQESGVTGVDPNESLVNRFLVQNIDDGANDVPPVYITNNLFFVNTAVTVNGSNRTERIAVSSFGKNDDQLWQPFMEFNGESDIRWIP